MYRRSFTLFEIILALGVASIILLVLISGFNLSIKIYKRVKELKAFQLIDFVEIISSDVRSCYLFDKKEALNFLGSKNSLEFIAVSSLKNNLKKSDLGDLKRVKYYLSQDDRGFKNLYRREEEFFSLGGTKEKRKLLDGLVYLNFLYFDGKEWKSIWNSPEIPPQAIKIFLKLKEGESFNTFSTVIDIP